MTSNDPFRATPELTGPIDPQEFIRRIQAEELSRSPSPGGLRAADIIQVKP